MSHDASWGIAAKLGTRAIQRRRLHAHAMYGCWIMHEITLIGWPVTCGRDYLPITSACGATVPTVIPMLLSNAQILRRGRSRPWQKKRALKFALKGSESFKACFDLYRCLNPEKSFKSSFKNDFWAFFHDFCSTMFRVVAWVQVEFRSLSSFRRCMLFDWLLLLLLLSKFTFSRDCVQGWWVPSSKVCFSAMADCISAKSHALNWALKCYKSYKTEL